MENSFIAVSSQIFEQLKKSNFDRNQLKLSTQHKYTYIIIFKIIKDGYIFEKIPWILYIENPN